MKQSFMISNDMIFYNGERIYPPKTIFTTGLNVAQCNGKLYVNGFEWVNGKWKRTLAAIWHYLF